MTFDVAEKWIWEEIAKHVLSVQKDGNKSKGRGRFGLQLKSKASVNAHEV